MGKQIKLIWDFRGPDASKTAKHHAQHLADYVLNQNIEPGTTGHTDYSSAHSMAYMIVEESRMITVRDSLAPHRGELYNS